MFKNNFVILIFFFKLHYIFSIIFTCQQPKLVFERAFGQGTETCSLN